MCYGREAHGDLKNLTPCTLSLGYLPWILYYLMFMKYLTMRGIFLGVLHVTYSLIFTSTLRSRYYLLTPSYPWENWTAYNELSSEFSLSSQSSLYHYTGLCILGFLKKIPCKDKAIIYSCLYLPQGPTEDQVHATGIQYLLNIKMTVMKSFHCVSFTLYPL